MALDELVPSDEVPVWHEYSSFYKRVRESESQFVDFRPPIARRIVGVFRRSHQKQWCQAFDNDD